MFEPEKDRSAFDPKRTLFEGINTMPMPKIFTVFILCLIGCVPYFYKGNMAFLEGNESITVSLRQKDFGDCSSYTTRPTVYSISRDTYTLYIAHGERYWPEFFLLATTKEKKTQLELTGQYIVPEEYKNFAGHKRIEKARGLELTHKTVRLDKISVKSIKVEIRNTAGEIMGTEKLLFKTEQVKCFAWDSV